MVIALTSQGGERNRVYSVGYVPYPASETVWGLPPPLSVIETEAVRFPLAWGVKVTLMLQLALGRRLLLQVFVCAKSAAFVPSTVTPAIASAVLELTFVSVTVCAALVVPTL